MIYKNAFEKFVKQGLNSYFIGTGNPEAEILFIGKESSIEDDNYDGRTWYSANAASWQSHIDNKTCEVLRYTVDVKHPLRKGWGRNTWCKYQKLTDIIYCKSSEDYEINFLEKVFTTELNDNPSKNTSTANKTNLKNKKEVFKNSEFIQQFPVVVLACSNYIRNNDKIREIDDIFGTTYIGDQDGKYWYSKGNWFFLNYSSDKSKLVIHTRQLSSNVNNSMLQEMGTVIRKHLGIS